MFTRSLASKLTLGAAAVAAGGVVFGGIALAAFGGSPFATSAAVSPTVGAAPLAEDRKGDRLGTLARVLDGLLRNGTITAEQRDKIVAAIREAAQQERGRGPNALLADAAKIIGISAGDLRKELAGKSLAQVAQAHGVSRDTLVQRLGADTKRSPELVARLVDHVWSGPQRGERDGKAFVGDLFQEAAKAIGIRPADLKRELAGKSLAQVAQAHNVSRDALVQALTASSAARIDQARGDGKLGADQAAKLKARLAGLVTKLVDRVSPPRQR